MLVDLRSKAYPCLSSAPLKCSAWRAKASEKQHLPKFSNPHTSSVQLLSISFFLLVAAPKVGKLASSSASPLTPAP